MPKEHLQLGAHFIVTAVFMSCWLGGMGRPAMVAIAAVAGAVFHTIADTAVDPRRGGDQLTGTVISNLAFTTLSMGAFAFLLPPL
jgi:hypothetical protein